MCGLAALHLTLIGVVIFHGIDNWVHGGLLERPLAFTCSMNYSVWQYGFFSPDVGKSTEVEISLLEDGGDVVPFVEVLVKGVVHDAAVGGFVALVGAGAPVVDGEFFKVGEDAQGQFAAPGVAAQLEGGVEIIFDVDGGLFGFDEEFCLPADAESVIGGFGFALHFNGRFVHHVFVCFGVALFVVHVPAERLEEGVDEFAAGLGFVVDSGAVIVAVALELGDEFVDFLRGWHMRLLGF